MSLDPMTPVVVKIVEAPSRETTVADVLLGAVGLVGVLLVAALLVGLIAGGIFILVRKLRAPDDPAAAPADAGLHLSTLNRQTRG